MHRTLPVIRVWYNQQQITVYRPECLFTALMCDLTKEYQWSSHGHDQVWMVTFICVRAKQELPRPITRLPSFNMSRLVVEYLHFMSHYFSLDMSAQIAVSPKRWHIGAQRLIDNIQCHHGFSSYQLKWQSLSGFLARFHGDFKHGKSPNTENTTEESVK